MKVLVTAASRHGATAEIAQAIARTLHEHGLDADEREPDQVHDLSGYDAAVVGSAVYVGHWLDGAKQLIERQADALRAMPVWLFSSGPIGDPPKPTEDPVDVADLLETTQANDHRVFAGRLDKGRLSLGEKAVVVALRAPVGDYRDWDDIAAWAGQIAATLQREAAS